MSPARLLSMLLLLGAAPLPRRVLSLNLCADQLLVALADPAQVTGLTRLVRDPAMSAAAGTAGAFPVSGSSVEDVLVHRPDLILAGWPGQADRALRLGSRARVLVVPPANSYSDIVAQVRAVAAALGHSNRGERLVAAMDRQLAYVRPRDRAIVVAEYQRGGFLSGGGTLLDEMIRRSGLINLATRLGRGSLSRLSIEEIVAAHPDALIVGEGAGGDLGSSLRDHPALRKIPRLRVPSALTTCGGPVFPTAIRMLATQANRVRR